MSSDAGIIIHSGPGNDDGLPMDIQMIHHEGVSSVKINGPGMSFTKRPVIINFTDFFVSTRLNNLKPVTAAPYINIPMGRFAARVNLLAVPTS